MVVEIGPLAAKTAQNDGRQREERAEGEEVGHAEQEEGKAEEEEEDWETTWGENLEKLKRVELGGEDEGRSGAAGGSSSKGCRRGSSNEVSVVNGGAKQARGRGRFTFGTNGMSCDEEGRGRGGEGGRQSGVEGEGDESEGSGSRQRETRHDSGSRQRETRHDSRTEAAASASAPSSLKIHDDARRAGSCPWEESGEYTRRRAQYGEGGQVLELSDIPCHFTSTDLESLLAPFPLSPLSLHWLTSSHALLVLPSPAKAASCLQYLKSEPFSISYFSEASEEFHLARQKGLLDLNVPVARPKTTARAAQRMIAGALGDAAISRELRAKGLKKKQEEEKMEVLRKERIAQRHRKREEAWGDD